MKNSKYLQAFLILIVGFGLGYFLNQYSGGGVGQQARVLETKNVNQAMLINPGASIEQVKSAVSGFVNREVYQCDITGFIVIDWSQTSAWQGWLNAHECEWLFTL